MDYDLRQLVSEEVLFAREAAEFLSISPQRLNQLVHSNQLKPIKRSSAGTLFLKQDLVERKKGLVDIGREIANPKNNIKLNLSLPNIREAINYFTLQALNNYSDKRTEPIFNKISKSIDMTSPFEEISKELMSFLKIDISSLQKAYTNTIRGFEKLEQDDIIIKKDHPQYPSLLLSTEEASPFLFMRGNIDLLQERIVSVVGTRNPTPQGRERAFMLSMLLGRFGIVVASGLARGIDSAAHTAAVKNEQPTIAVIGTPITKVYPRDNEALQKQISEKGLLISQFPPSAKVERWFFPMRNAIMSGISAATVVVEAGETSGALKQATYALKQGRLVFIPQSAIDNPNLEWPKKYLKRKGAFKFCKITELLSELCAHSIIEKKEQCSLF